MKKYRKIVKKCGRGSFGYGAWKIFFLRLAIGLGICPRRRTTRVIPTHAGRDGMVRAVDPKRSDCAVFRRAIHKLAPLSAEVISFRKLKPPRAHVLSLSPPKKLFILATKFIGVGVPVVCSSNNAFGSLGFLPCVMNAGECPIVPATFVFPVNCAIIVFDGPGGPFSWILVGYMEP